MSAWCTQRAERLGSDVELTSDPLLTWPWRLTARLGRREHERAGPFTDLPWVSLGGSCVLHGSILSRGWSLYKTPGAIQSRATVSTHHEGEAKSAPRCRT